MIRLTSCLVLTLPHADPRGMDLKCGIDREAVRQESTAAVFVAAFREQELEPLTLQAASQLARLGTSTED